LGLKGGTTVPTQWHCFFYSYILLVLTSLFASRSLTGWAGLWVWKSRLCKMQFNKLWNSWQYRNNINSRWWL